MSSDVSFEVDLTDWDRTVRDIEAEHDDFSGKTFEKYARGLFRRVLGVIPPPSVGAGRRAIRRDYASGYPRGARLNKELRKLKRPLRTAFWSAYFRGDMKGMREILKKGGSSLATVTIAPFDQGRAMRGYKSRKWSGGKPPPPLRIVMNPEAVDPYVKELEGHVGKLKSALIPALRKLSIAFAAYIAHHGGGRGQFRMDTRKTFKSFEWIGKGSDYDPALIAILNHAIQRAARAHVEGMRKELANYSPEKKAINRALASLRSGAR